MESPSKQLGGKEKKKKKKSSSKKHKIREMHIKPADNGGFAVTHDYNSEEPDENGVSNTPDSSLHALGDADQLGQHVAEQFPPAAPVQGAAPAGAAPAGAQSA